MESATHSKGLRSARPATPGAIPPAVHAPANGRAMDVTDGTGRLVHTARLAALGEIAAGVAHEMNQPLAAIRMLVTSMLADIDAERLDTGRARQWLDTINGQIGRLSWIIDHVRSFSRNEPPDEEAVTDVGETVRNTLALLSAQFGGRGIRVETDMAPTLAGARIDGRHLEQVLINLLSNARDALDALPDDADKRIHIRAVEGPDAGMMTIEVSDNGPGMPHDVSRRVFEPFFTTKKAGQGTGIGLSIVRTILGKSGARINVDSEPGEGTTFRVVLPVASLDTTIPRQETTR